MSETWLVEVTRRAPDADPAGARLLRKARALGLALEGVRLAEVFELEPVGRAAAERLAQELLSDPVLDQARVVAAEGGQGAAAPRAGEAVLTVLRREGVMDPVALSTVVAARDLGLDLGRVRTARRVYLAGAGGRAPAEPALAPLARALGNAVVDQVLAGPVDLPPRARPGATPSARREVPLAGLDDAALVALSRARTLALDAVEMRAVQAHYAALGRAPTDLELETIAQTWSEHCKHKTLAGPVEYVEHDASGREVARKRYANLLKETIFAATQELNAPRCLSVFEDNAGVIRFDGQRGLAIKVETHNHPSAIEPYGGAGTGVGGVIRDILGTGLSARPVANVDVFCVGPLDLPQEQLLPGALHPRDVLAGVVSGVRDYGNCMGIPTVAGALVTEPRYAGNPLVFCGTVGVIPAARVAKRAHAGDWLVAVGGRTGRDGIHGATFSSEALDAESEAVNGGAVQIGNPIEEKKLLDVLLDVRERGWLSAVTDCGAGGFSSAVGEMADGLGARIELGRAPLKYAGLAPWEVWVSEAQERMVLAVPPAHGPALLAAFAAEDVQAVHLGDLTADGRLVLSWEGQVVGELELEFLHRGLPRQERKATWRSPAPLPLAPGAPLPHGEALRRILATPSVCSKEWIVRQYDHEVQGGSALKALVGADARGPSDAAAFCPLPGSPRVGAVAMGLNPRHGLHDPRLMALSAVDEALRNLVAIGIDPDTVGVLDNFSWGDCRRPEQLGALARTAEGLRAAALAYGVPFVSGKDSLNNEYALPDGKRVAIPGTILVTALGVGEDARGLISMDLKRPGDPVYLVGATRAELLGSFWAEVTGARGGQPPTVDLERAPALLRAVWRAIRAGVVRAAHDLAEGGLAVAAAEMAFAGQVGLELDLARVPVEVGGEGEVDDVARLFSESPTRLLLEVDAARAGELEALLAGSPFARVGTTVATPRLVVRGRAGVVLDEPLDALLAAWRDPLFALYG